MKILWVSDAAWHTTGYGTQTREICRRLVADGHEVVNFCAGAFVAGKAPYEGMTVVGSHMNDDRWGNRSIGDIINWCQPDVVVTWLDVHGMLNYGWHPEPWIAWAPIDTEPIPKSEREILGRASKILVPSKWGQQVLDGAQVTSTYVPCGLNTGMFDISAEGRARWRKQVRPQISDETFLIGMVGLNTGMPDRKGYGFAFEVLKRFRDNHPNDPVTAYIHTDPTGGDGAMDLTDLREQMGLTGLIALSPPQLPWGATGTFMRDMYNAFDVFLHTAITEGFGVPVVEAQACGTPVVVNACTSVTELAPLGYRAKPQASQWIPTSTQVYYPDVDGMVTMLELAYADWREGKHDRKTIRAGVLKYDYDTVYQAFWRSVMASVPEKVNFEEAGGKVGPKLMLAAGSDRKEGFVHHDREKLWPHIDVAHDLNVLPWPWEDATFGYVEFSDCLEHLRASMTDVMDELWRITKPDGFVYLHTAEAGTWQLMKDPTHVQGFMPQSFNYFDPDYLEAQQYVYSDRKWKIVRRTADAGGIALVMQPRKESPVLPEPELEAVPV